MQLHRRVATVRSHKQFLLVTLEGCDSMSAAEELVGYEVCVREQDLPPLAANQIYHYQLIGMTVVTTQGTHLGIIAEVMSTKSSDVCVVRDGAREYLVPWIDNVVKHVDPDTRQVTIDPLPGLLDE